MAAPARAHGRQPVHPPAPPAHDGFGPPLPPRRQPRHARRARGAEDRLLGRAPFRLCPPAVREHGRRLLGLHDGADEMDRRLGIRPGRQPLQPPRLPLLHRGRAQAGLAAQHVLPAHLVAAVQALQRLRLPDGLPALRGPARRKNRRALPHQQHLGQLHPAGGKPAERADQPGVQLDGGPAAAAAPGLRHPGRGRDGRVRTDGGRRDHHPGRAL